MSQATAALTLLPESIPSVIRDMSADLPECAPDPLQSTIAQPLLKLEALLCRLLLVQLRTLGLFEDAPVRPESLARRLTEPYPRWLTQSLAFLVEHGRVVQDGRGYALTDPRPDPAWQDWEQERARWLNHPDFQAQATLVEATLRALPDILAGRIPATQVLFPQGSMSRVQGIYQGHRIADYFNDRLAETLRVCLETRLRLDPAAQCRLLEIGAGTGGTTARVLPLLDPHRAHLREYAYTDLSQAFLRHGEEQYGSGRPYLACRLFDVETSPTAQGFTPGSYDFVLATNVLHATRDLRQTLRNAKALLKRHGLLLVNEISQNSLFAHLTFGLLDGWWRYRDAALRLPGCPGVAPATWRRLLESEGFRTVRFPAEAAHSLGQQIILAESDGMIRLSPSSALPQPPERHRLSPPAPVNRGSLQEQTTAYLKALMAETLKIPVERIDATEPFEKYGIDSIVVVQLTNRLGAVLDDIHSTLFFEHQTLDALVGYLVDTHGEKLVAKLGLRQSVPRPAQPQTPAPQPINIQRETSLPVAEEMLRNSTLAYLKAHLAETLKIPVERIDATEPFEKYGIDSIVVVQLTNRLGAVLDDIQSTLFFEYQTLTALTEHLLTTHREALMALLGLRQAPPAVAAIAPPVPPPIAAHPIPHTRPTPPRLETPHSAQAIAIIGLAGRYPQAETLSEFWHNLKNAKNCITEIPPERWNWRTYFHADKGKLGTSYSKWGGFIQDIDKFDPLFFHIAPREAEYMDPQERLFLQTAYAVLEDAGYTPASLSTSRKVGVFVGVMNGNYPTGGQYWSIANRVSYTCNFQGPSLAVDTACSSSLTAIHLAIESLISGSCECAIAGGVNLIVDPIHYLRLSALTMLSAQDHCRPFGDQADGFVDGEGVGAVLLKPLDRAIADRDLIYGIIRGSQLNAGGKTNGYTVPNPLAQAELIADTLQKAHIHPRAMSYLEAHGTGTALGDPIEIAGLNRAFRKYTQDKQFCAIGSVKSNIGHCESAAGIAGLTKVLLQLKYQHISPSLHAAVPNPNIDFKNTAFKVQHTLEHWPRPVLDIHGESREYPRIAGISSFGAGGANAHLVVEEYIPTGPKDSKLVIDAENPAIILLSAKDQTRLKALAQQLWQWLAAGENPDLADLAYTLQIGREAMATRLAFLATSLDELTTKLHAFVADSDYAGLYQGQIKRDREALGGLAGDEDMAATLQAWISKRKYTKLLELWVQGLNLDWHQLYGTPQPRRISLPTYPFARERYWLSTPLLQPPQAAEPVSNFLYKPLWRETPFVPSAPATGGKTVLIFYPEASPELSHALEQAHAGDRVITLQPATLDAVLDNVQAIDCIYFLGGLLSGPLTPEPDSVAALQERGVLSLFLLLQTLAQANQTTQTLQLKIITNNVHPVRPGENTLPYAASLHGLAKTAAREYPFWKISCLDIDIQELNTHPSLIALTQRILQEPAHTNGEDIALRQDQRYQRIIQAAPLPAGNPPFRKEGVYLILGGTGGIGFAFAEYLATTFQARLILVGRSALNPEKQAQITQIESLGGTALYLPADITDIASMNKVIDQINHRFGTIHGVIHSAAVAQDKTINNLDEAAFRVAMEPKILGTMVLYKLLAGNPLDFVLFFSSINAFIGNAGQGNYAAACTFQDAFAYYWQSQVNYPVRVINWGYWGGAGMAASPEIGRRMLGHGFLPIHPQEGVEAISRIMASDEQQIIAVKLTEQLQAALEGDWRPTADRPQSVREPMLQQTDLPGALKTMLAEILKIPSEKIDQDISFQDYGIDSVYSIVFIKQIENSFNIKLHPSSLISYPTIEQLAGHITALSVAPSAVHNAELDTPDISTATIDEKPLANTEITERPLDNILLLLGHSILEFFREQGLFNDQTPISTATLKVRLNIAQELQYMLDVFLRVLETNRLITIRDGYIHLNAAAKDAVGIDSRLELLMRALPDFQPYFKLFQLCRQYYPDLLSGRLAANDLLYAEAATRILVEQACEGGHRFSKVLNSAISDHLCGYIKKAPDLDNTLRILELGTGALDISTNILNTLVEANYDNKLEYYFSSTPPELAKLRATLANDKISYIEYPVEIENIAAILGQKKRFDIIAMQTSTESTEEFARMASAIKNILNPEGILIIIDPIESWYLAMTLGFLGRAWAYPFSCDYPRASLNTNTWEHVLSEAGYNYQAALEQRLIFASLNTEWIRLVSTLPKDEQCSESLRFSSVTSSTATQQEWAYGLNRNILTTKAGRQVEFFHGGEGEAIVFLTALAFTYPIWQYQIEKFRKHYRLIFPHILPGHAGSVFSGDFTFEGLADDLAELLDHLSISSAHIIGWCMAGNIAQLFSLRYSHRVRTLSLICTTPTDARVRGLQAKDIRNYSDNSYLAYELEFQNIYGMDYLYDESVREYLNIIRNSSCKVEEAAVLQHIYNVFNFDSTARLADIKPPTLVVAGQWDIAFPTDQVSLLNKGIKESKFIELERAGHLPFVNQHETFNEILQKFLKSPYLS